MPDTLRHYLFIAVPLLVVLAVLPSVYNNHLLLFNFVIFFILAQGVNIIYGFTGYLPFGYVGFFGAGAYGFALMVMHLNSPAPVAVLAGGLVAVVLGLILTPLLRLAGAYFSIANLAAALAVLHLIANPALESITKGPYGVALNGTFNPTWAYAGAVLILALTLGIVVYLKNSSFGLALQAVREDSFSASMSGVNVVKMRTIAWLASALVAGLAGGVFAWYVSVFYPDNVFSADFSIFAIVFALFGGVATICGPLIGVIILYGIYNLIGFTTPQYFQLIYGLLIMGLVLFLPAGLVSLAAWSAGAYAGAVEQLNAFVSNVSTARGEFVQRQVKGGTNGSPLRVAGTSNGDFVFSRPGRFVWRYVKPYEQQLSADGQTLYIFDKDLNQITERKLDASLGSSPAAILFGSNDLAKNFTLKEGGTKDGIDWAELESIVDSSEETPD